MKFLAILLLLCAQSQAAISFLNLGALGSSGNAITVGQPATPAINDIWIMVVQSANQAITTPTNATAGTWAEIATQTGTGTAATAGSVMLGFYWHRWTTATGNITLADTGNHQICQIAAYRGVKTTGNPWNAVTTMASGTWTTGFIWSNAITTTVDNCWHLLAVAHSEDIADTPRFTGPTQFSPTSSGFMRIDNTLATGTGGGIGLFDAQIITAGSTNGTSNGTRIGLATNPTNYIKVVVALEPQPPPTQKSYAHFMDWFSLMKPLHLSYL